MTERREDLLFAEHVLQRGFVTEAQVQECRGLLERLRGEMELDESLANVLQKKGYLSETQRRQAEAALDPAQDASKNNAIPGYQLLERVGFGAMGSVYKARHLDLDILVAVKVLRVALASSRTQVERLKREARLVARLTHPNIVLSRDVGDADGLHYLVMEFVDGETVRAKLDDGPLPEKEALRITLETARALEHAHEHGVVHRDVKPGNIMVGKDGQIKLADFGLARGKAPSDLTMEHASLGTPQYVAPEQMRRAADATSRSDLFGLGASLYHMVTGQPPFRGESLGEIVQKVMVCDFVPPEKAKPELSHDTVYLIHRLMRADPARRYPNAAAVIADLERLAAGEAIAPRGFQGDHAAYVGARRKKMAIVGGSIAVATLGLAVWAFLGWRSARAEEQRSEHCATLDRTGADADPMDAPALRALSGRLRSAWGQAGSSDCRRAEVAGLEQRSTRARADVAALDRAEQAIKENAAYAIRHRRVLDEREKVHYAATKSALARIAGRIAADSERAANGRWRKALALGNAGEVLAALRSFRDDASEYVGGRGGPKAGVDELFARFEKLHGRWAEIDGRFGESFRAAEQARNWARAHEALEELQEAQRDALKAVESAFELAAPVRRFFPVADPGPRLKKLEREEFEGLERATRTLGGIGDPATVIRKLKAFEDRAKHYKQDARKLRERLERSGSAQERAEDALLDAVERDFEASLRRRRWAELEIRLRRVKTGDIVRRSGRLDELRGRAAAFAELRKRLKRDARADERTQDLVALLGELSPRLAGCFWAGEAFAVAADHAAALAHLDRALKHLGSSGWAPRLEEERKRREAARQADDKKAGTLYGTFAEQLKTNQYSQALATLEILLGRYRFTDTVRDARTELEKQRKQLDLKAGDDRLCWAAGLPRGALRRDRDGALVIKFDFEAGEWWPDEAPPDAEDPRAAKDRIRAARFEQHGHDTPGKVRRAAHRLCWFSGNLEPAAKYAVFRRPRTEEEALGATDWRREGRLEPVTWTVPRLDLDAGDWSVEIDVSWAGDPGYFVLAGGAFQGGVLYAPRLAGKGGGQTARLFRHPDLDHDKLEALFRRAAPRGTGADLPKFRVAANGRLRLRLALRRKGRAVTFTITPVAGGEPITVQQRASSGKHGSGFRFASLRRFRVHSVTVTGKQVAQ